MKNIKLYKCVKTCECLFGTYNVGKTYEIEALRESNLVYAYHHKEDMNDYDTILKQSEFIRIMTGHKFSLLKNHKIISQNISCYLYFHEFFIDLKNERKLKLQKINGTKIHNS